MTIWEALATVLMLLAVAVAGALFLYLAPLLALATDAAR